jgi:hypothetical protein
MRGEIKRSEPRLEGLEHEKKERNRAVIFNFCLLRLMRSDYFLSLGDFTACDLVGSVTFLQSKAFYILKR